MKKKIIYSTILIFGIGFAFHYLYDFSNENFLVGLFTPVNESIYEHLKLLLYPILIWWICVYMLKRNKQPINKNSWFSSMLISIIISIFLVNSFYYILKGGFNIEKANLNIFIMIISILISQTISLVLYEKKYKINIYLLFSIILIIIISSIYLTIKPLKLPIFQDQNTGYYGIYKITEN